VAAAAGLGAKWLEPLCRGERRAGVALGGTIPGSPLRARPVRGGYLLEHPQRLAREALFLLVFGSRPAIKERLVGRLTGR